MFARIFRSFVILMTGNILVKWQNESFAKLNNFNVNIIIDATKLTLLIKYYYYTIKTFLVN